MFDEPSPDTTEILERDDYSVSETSSGTKDYSNNYTSTYQSSRPSYQDSNENIIEVVNIENFAAKVLKGDVKNYLRLKYCARLKSVWRGLQSILESNQDRSKEPRAL